MIEKRMVPVEEALRIVAGNGILMEDHDLPLEKALGSVLSRDISSPLDQPPFRQAAMDGYAICGSGHSQYQVVGEVRAGDGSPMGLRPGEAVRIYTGAMVPASADRVVVQEKAVLRNGKLHIELPMAGSTNIRPQGEQLKKGALALQKGTMITPATIGFLAGMGIFSLPVFKRPKVGIVITGNELVTTGGALDPGQIYEGNSKMLLAALAQMGIVHTTLYHTPDELGPCRDTLSKALQNNDVLLVSGGISVGDHDHVYAALKELQVTGLFHKVRQKPGKPLFFGRKDQTAIFALPGNPASALCCFYIYAYPFLQRSMGLPGTGLPEREGSCGTFIANTLGRAQFLTANWQEDGGVQPLAGQGPVGLQAFGLANALIFVPETLAQVEKGERVRTFLLPY